MSRSVRMPLVLSLALLLILTTALPALADRDDGERERGRSSLSGRVLSERHDDDDEDEDEAFEHGGFVEAAPAPEMDRKLALPAARDALARAPRNPNTLANLRTQAQRGGPATLWVDGKALPAGLRQEQGQVLVPLRPVAEALNVQVREGAGGQVSLQRGPRQAQLAAGSTAASLSGTALQLDVAPRLLDGTLHVSLRTLADVLGVQVLHDPVSGLVVVSAAPAL